MREVRAIVIAATFFLLAGCGTLRGLDYKWTGTDWLVLGSTRPEQIVAEMGPANVTYSMVRGQLIKVLVFHHEVSRVLNVIFHRKACFYFADDVLVGFLYKDDEWGRSTNFDSERAKPLSKGSATRSDVERALGKPNGVAVYPLADEKETTELRYSYEGPEGFIVRWVRKDVFVTVDRNNKLSALSFVVESNQPAQNSKWSACEHGIRVQ